MRSTVKTTQPLRTWRPAGAAQEPQPWQPEGWPALLVCFPAALPSSPSRIPLFPHNCGWILCRAYVFCLPSADSREAAAALLQQIRLEPTGYGAPHRDLSRRVAITAPGNAKNGKTPGHLPFSQVKARGIPHPTSNCIYI